MHPDEKSLECPLCGRHHGAVSLQPGQRALCERCGAEMAERGWLGPDAAVVFAITGLILAVPALLLPFVTLKKFGSERTSLLTGAGEGLWQHGFGSLGTWVFFCGIVAPCSLLALILATRWTDQKDDLRTWNSRFRRWARGVEYWAIPEVQVLGVLVAFFKLGDLVSISVGPGLWCYGATSLFALLAWRRFDLQCASERLSPEPGAGVDPVVRHPPKTSSANQAAALAVSAVILLIPAYILPVMRLGMFGKAASDTTIFSGIIQLWQQGLIALAAIVFTASFVVPLLKLAGLVALLTAVWRKPSGHSRTLTRIYGWIDFIGRWSMLDVFLVAFLSGAVQFGKMASVHPRPGILAFGAVVVFTMLATRRFDPRLLWITAPAAEKRAAIA